MKKTAPARLPAILRESLSRRYRDREGRTDRVQFDIGCREASTAWIMDPYESHSFIVKIWLEESLDEADTATWRGHITHVPSQERRYLNALDDVVDFVGPYLERLGVKSSAYRRGRLKRPRSNPD